MSLKQEERDIMVALELEKADSTFAEHALTKGLTLCEHSIAILLCTTVDSCPMPCSV